jgi:hypothetical protein
MSRWPAGSRHASSRDPLNASAGVA